MAPRQLICKQCTGLAALFPVILRFYHRHNCKVQFEGRPLPYDLRRSDDEVIAFNSPSVQFEP